MSKSLYVEKSTDGARPNGESREVPGGIGAVPEGAFFSVFIAREKSCDCIVAATAVYQGTDTAEQLRKNLNDWHKNGFRLDHIGMHRVLLPWKCPTHARLVSKEPSQSHSEGTASSVDCSKHEELKP